MDTSRFVIRDHQWAKMEPHCLGLKAHPGRTGSDARLFMEAVFWIARTGSPWRGLPPVPGLGAVRCFRAHVQRFVRPARYGDGNDRRKAVR